MHIANQTFANTPEKLAVAFKNLRIKLNLPPRPLPERQQTGDVLHEMAYRGCHDFMSDMYGGIQTVSTRRDLSDALAN